MSVAAEDRDFARPAGRSHWPALVVVAAGSLCLVGAGVLLWGWQGEAVFSDTVLAALAWCF